LITSSPASVFSTLEKQFTLVAKDEVSWPIDLYKFDFALPSGVSLGAQAAIAKKQMTQGTILIRSLFYFLALDTVRCRAPKRRIFRWFRLISFAQFGEPASGFRQARALARQHLYKQLLGLAFLGVEDGYQGIFFDTFHGSVFPCYG
jgi:hypothetical protein